MSFLGMTPKDRLAPTHALGDHRDMKGATIAVLACLAVASHGVVFTNQIPPNGGGIKRWSKLWIDPTGQNDYDTDAICYEDFTLSQRSSIDHIEWWGDANPNLGFQIEFWRQDPGTSAYQPLAVFRDSGAQPERAFITTSYGITSDHGITHYLLDLANPVVLNANDAGNVRWFIAIIARDSSAPLLWNWAQGLGGSNRTFQWIRADGNNFHSLGEGRALVLSGQVVPEPASIVAVGLGIAALVARRRRRQ